MYSDNKKLLLQICCAPDATVVVERLRPLYDITGYFYNPNIHPEEEYKLRTEEMLHLASKMYFPIEIGPYETREWYKRTSEKKDSPEGGERCQICYRMRLEKAAGFAVDNQFNLFTTVLTVSPHKNADIINAMGSEIAKAFGIEFLSANFKKNDGFKRSIELSKIFNLYRQDYCGCIYSKQ